MASSGGNWAVACVIGMGAFLLFGIQPLVGKYLLPWFGGTPAVWSTCLVFFQTALLAGYLYAHLLTRYLRGWQQRSVHLAVLVLTALALPANLAVPPPGVDSGAQPIRSIFIYLVRTIGLPYFVLATTSPLLQKWWSQGQANPYRLYAVSNLGSLAALFAYPIAIEPVWSRGDQAWGWSLVCWAFLALYALTTLQSASTPLSALEEKAEGRKQKAEGQWKMENGKWKMAGGAEAADLVIRIPHSALEEKAKGKRQKAEGGSRNAVAFRIPHSALRTPHFTGSPPPLDRLWWVLLPAIGSMLLLGITNKLCQDLAPVPMLWLLPLGLYLVSFIISFDHPRWFCPRLLTALFPLAAGVALFDVMVDRLGRMPVTVHLVVFNAVLFIGCLLCHGELARRQPGPAYLTQYYLSLATGGALGGMAVAFAAPVILSDYGELQLTLLLCLTMLPVVLHGSAERELFARRAGATLAESAGNSGHADPSPSPPNLADPTAAFYEAWLSARPRLGRFWRAYIFGGLGCLLTLSWASVAIGGGEHFRNFYGVVSVIETHWRGTTNEVRLLQHGQITHGTEFLSGPYTNLPGTYYGPHSGVGRMLGRLRPDRPKKVGVLGLGIGNLSVYAHPSDTWIYYEINPAIITLAQTRFDELRRHPCHVEILAGDARQRLTRQSPQAFDCLVVDVFNGDSIPTHLLTRQALELYRRHLKPEGILAIHISNRYLDLEPVIRRLANQCGWSITVTHTESRNLDLNETKSVWAVLTPGTESPSARLTDPGTRQARVWTDDYTAILPILRWAGRE